VHSLELPKDICTVVRLFFKGCYSIVFLDRSTFYIFCIHAIHTIHIFPIHTYTLAFLCVNLIFIQKKYKKNFCSFHNDKAQADHENEIIKTADENSLKNLSSFRIIL
jgi:hypothetical protein